MSAPMNSRVAVTHTLEQRFERPVRLSTHWLRLRPAPQTRARVTAYSLALLPRPHFLNWVRDPFENHIARLDLPEPVKSLRIELEFIAELAPVNPFDFLTEPDAAQYPFDYPAQLRKELASYLRLAGPGPRLTAWLAQLDRTAASTVQRLEAVNRQVQEMHRLSPTVSPGPVDPEGVLERHQASSWELAWLLTLSLRHLGLAARFVCGYRIMIGQATLGQDGASLHAWSEVYLPGAGWIGLDPAAGLFTTESYIPLACAPDPLRVLPIVGYREACEETQVERNPLGGPARAGLPGGARSQQPGTGADPGYQFVTGIGLRLWCARVEYSGAGSLQAPGRRCAVAAPMETAGTRRRTATGAGGVVCGGCTAALAAGLFFSR